MPRTHEDGESPRGRRRYSSSSSSSSSSSGTYQEIPFRDADPDTDETPLEELDTFVIPGADERGASEHIHMRLTPHLRRQIKIILNSNRFPYLTEASFLRHAAVRHLNWLVSLRYSIPKHILPALAMILEVCRDDEMRIQIEHVFQKIDERISFHLSRGDHSEVIRLLNLVKTRMTGVQPSTWQRQFWAHFNQKWAGYLAATEKQQSPDGPGVH